MTMQHPTPQNLASIRVLTYFQGAFVGIPYPMRDGQQPRDIDAKWRDSESAGAWIWLGSPGWYGSMNAAEKEMAIAFVKRHGSDVQWHEWCWVDIAPECEEVAA
jgi:hypothetical protein